VLRDRLGYQTGVDKTYENYRPSGGTLASLSLHGPVEARWGALKHRWRKP